MKKRILVTPLNWGLGHVTRSIPLINALLDKGCEVFLASDGVAYFLLKAEFPDLPIFELPSYGMRYDTDNMVRNIAPRLPKLLLAVRHEQQITEAFVQKNKIDGILSDNRYGCFADCPTVLLTHQLHLRFPNSFLQSTANWMLHRALKNFDRIWIPDAAAQPNLSGALSHNPLQVHPKIDFIGILSRMQKFEVEKEYDVAVILSGPEPQRTILEEKLMEQALEMPERFIFVQGKTQSHHQYFAAENIEVTSYLTSTELNKVILASDVIVCRSGYSSLMDLARTGKKALIIATPGQTEQEYLAEKCAEMGYFASQTQAGLQLEEGIKKAQSCTGFDSDDFPVQNYLSFLNDWIEKL